MGKKNKNRTEEEEEENRTLKIHTNYDVDRQCRDTKGNGYQHIQQETANQDAECHPKRTETTL